MLETKITKIRVKNHLTYSAWKYICLVIAVVFGWNLIYTTTAYRPPENKKVDVYFAIPSITSENLEMLEALATPAFPDMEEIHFFSIAMNTDDDYYGNIQMTTYIGAQEGDLFIMDKSRFLSYAEGSAFVDLNQAVADGRIQLNGQETTGGWGKDMDGVQGLYGIPISSLYGLWDYGIDNRNLVVGVMAYTQNEENAIKMVNWLLQTMKADRPEWMDALEEREKALKTEKPETVLPSY